MPGWPEAVSGQPYLPRAAAVGNIRRWRARFSSSTTTPAPRPRSPGPARLGSRGGRRGGERRGRPRSRRVAARRGARRHRPPRRRRVRAHAAPAGHPVADPGGLHTLRRPDRANAPAALRAGACGFFPKRELPTSRCDASSRDNDDDRHALTPRLNRGGRRAAARRDRAHPDRRGARRGRPGRRCGRVAAAHARTPSQRRRGRRPDAAAPRARRPGRRRRAGEALEPACSCCSFCEPAFAVELIGAIARRAWGTSPSSTSATSRRSWKRSPTSPTAAAPSTRRSSAACSGAGLPVIRCIR